MTALGIAKTLLNIVIFIAGCLSIIAAQATGIVLAGGNKEFRQAWLAHTKEHFIVLLTTVLNIASKGPIKIRLVCDKKSIPPSRLNITSAGKLEAVLPARTLMIANHQIYTDWAFLWWLAYTAKLGGFFYIILKASLRKLPVLGWGMKNYEFIFLSRKWETDKLTMGNQLASLDANARGKGEVSGNSPQTDKENRKVWPKGEDKLKTWPYSLLIFPEGTNMSSNTRESTEAYAKKVGKIPFKHVLLPRTTGLRYSLLKLRDTIDEVYDITLAYSGLKASDYGQDIYKIERVFLEGKNPEQIDFFIRSFKIDEIPIGKEDENEEESKISQKLFEDWLFNIWAEKDQLMDTYYETGSFLTDKDDEDRYQIVDTTFKVSKFHFLKLFFIPALILLVVRIIYQIYMLFKITKN